VFINSNLLKSPPYIKHLFHKDWLFYFCCKRGVPFLNYIIQLYWFFLFWIIAHSSFLLLTTFSSTTKRSLQPHDDKLLIGDQQPPHQYSFFTALSFPSLSLSGFSFRTAVFLSWFLILPTWFRWRYCIFSYFIHDSNNMQCCFTTDFHKDKSWMANSTTFVSTVHAMTPAFLSDHKRILLCVSQSSISFT